MKSRIIAYYHPLFHPISKNDDVRVLGGTEWTNAAKARPLFQRALPAPKLHAALLEHFPKQTYTARHHEKSHHEIS